MHPTPARDFNGSAASVLLEADREQKVLTHDGWVWPFPRAAMVRADACRARMTEDLQALIREAGAFESVSDAALIALGWRPEQVRLWGAAAVRAITADDAGSACRAAEVA